MGKIDEIIFEFEASVRTKDGQLFPFSIQVARPVYDGEGGCYCAVDCSFLKKSVYKMYGAHEEQACELTISFARQRLHDMGAQLIDKSGLEIVLPAIEYNSKH